MLVLIGYQCLKSQGASQNTRTTALRKIRGRDDIQPQKFDDLWELFHSSKRRVLTQHVVAETYGLRKKLEFHKDLVWQSATKLLRDPGLEELPCVIADLLKDQGYSEVMKALGPIDAGLLSVAEGCGAVILTEDRKFRAMAEARKVKAISVYEVENL